MKAGTLEVDMVMNLVRLVQDVAQAKRTIGEGVEVMKKAAESAKRALELIGAGFTVHEIKEKFNSIVEGLSKLQDASEKTGASVENLSKLQFFANVSGSSIDGVTAALAKLSKNMAGAGVDTAAASQAFKFLGLSAKDASGNLKDPAVFLGEISKKLIQYEDGAGKAALAQAMLNKGGAELLPTLKKMAELGDVEATVTKEQTEAAEAYEVEVARLKQRKEALWNTVVSALLPTMKDFVDVLLDASKKSGGLHDSITGLANDHSIEDWADAAAMAVATVIDGFKLLPALFSVIANEATAAVGFMDVLLKYKTLTDPAAMAGEVLKGNNPITDFTNSIAAMKLAQADADASMQAFLNSEVDGTQKAMAAKIAARKNYNTFVEQMDKDDMAMLDAMFGSEEEKLKKANFSMGDAAKAAAELKLYEGAVRKLEDELGKLNGQTEQQKLAFELYGKTVITADGQSVHLTGSLEKLSAEHKKMLPIIAAEVDAKKTQIAVSESLVKAIEAQIAAQAALDASTNQFFTTHAKTIADMQFETSMVGKLDVERKRATATRQIDLDLDKQLGVLADNETLSMAERVTKTAELIRIRDQAVASSNNEIEVGASAIALNQRNIEQIQFETSLIGLNTTEREQAIAVRALELTGIDKNTEAFKAYVEQLKGAIAAKNFADESQKVLVGMWQQVDQAGRDTFSAIFDKGDDAFKRLKDSLKKNLIDILYALTVRPLLIQIVASTAGSGVAQQVFGAAATQGGGTSGLLNLLSSGKSIADLFNGNSTISNVANFLGIGSSAGAGIGTAGASALSSGVSQGLLFGSLPAEGFSVGGAGGALLGSAGGAIGGGATSLEAASLLGSAAPGAFGGVAFGGAALTEGAVAGGAAAAGAGAGAAAMGALAAAAPYVAAAVAIASALGLFGGSKKIPAVGMGGFTQTHDSSGAVTNQFTSPYGGDPTNAKTIVAGMFNTFSKLATDLGAKFDSVLFSFDSNSGNQSQKPNFAIQSNLIRGGVGSEYTVGEHVGTSRPLDEATVQLEASRAVLAALKASELPKYLQQAFDSITPASMSQQDIDNFQTFLSQLQQARELLKNIAAISGIKADVDTLVGLFGDVQTALPLLQSYFDNFFTDAEKHTQALKQVTDAMTTLGIATIPKTREEFRALVEAQDLTTDAGKKMFQSLIAIAPAFAAVTDALDAAGAAAGSLADRISGMQSDLIDALDSQISASQNAAKTAHASADAYRAAGQSLQDAIRALRQGGLSPLLPGQKLAESRNTLDSVFQQALSGDKGALSQLPGMAQDFLQASREFNASSQAYSSDFARVMQMLQEAGVASGTFAGQQDFLATTLDVQTGVLQEILATLQAPTPELDKLTEQLGVLQTVRDALLDASRNILTVNSSVVDQTGQVISGNSMISAQTGEIVALPRLISSYDYTVNDPALGGVIDVNDPVAIAEAQRLLSAAGPLAQGQYAIQDVTGRVVAATVDQSGIVTALTELTRDQAGTIAIGNALLDAQTRQIILGNTTLNATTGAIVQGVDQQTGKVIAGNSTSDAIRNLTARDTSLSEEMLVQLAANSTEQTSTFRSMVDGISSTVQALNVLIGLQQQLTAEEAARQAQAQADAAKAAQLAINQAALSSAAAKLDTVSSGAAAALQEMLARSSQLGVLLATATGDQSFFTPNPQTGVIETNFTTPVVTTGTPALGAQFNAEFYQPGGFFDRIFGPAAEQSALAQQIATLRDLITSLGGVPSHAGGLPFVPRDDYYAKLHQGEAVVDADSRAAISRYFGAQVGGGSGDSAEVCAELRALREEVRELRQQSHRDMDVQTNELKAGYREGAIAGAREQGRRSDNRVDSNRPKSR